MKENIKHILKEKGFKITEGRVKILHILKSAKRPITVDEIYHKLKEKNLNLATLYRALSAFVDSKIVSRVDFDDGSSRYEFHNIEHHHHFIVCRKCKKMREITDVCNLRIFDNKIISTTGFTQIEHQVAFYGICGQCR